MNLRSLLTFIEYSFPPFVFFILGISFNTFKMRFSYRKAKLKLGKTDMGNKFFFSNGIICNVLYSTIMKCTQTFLLHWCLLQSRIAEHLVSHRYCLEHRTSFCFCPHRQVLVTNWRHCHRHKYHTCSNEKKSLSLYHKLRTKFS